MLKFLRTLVLIGVSAVLITSTFSAQTTTPAQIARGCSANVSAIDYVGVALGNPFSAQRVTSSFMTSSDGSRKTMDLVEDVARDSSGRIRFQKHMRLPDESETMTLSNRDGEKFTPTKELLRISITIFDCLKGKTISIQPGLQIARVWERGSPSESPQRSRPYSSASATLLGKKLPPEISVEDLGYKEVEGIQAHGIKVTHLGTEKDGEWNGKPVDIYEGWASEDLAATILEIQITSKVSSESRRTLTNIRREEPEPSLFEIPPGYKINPSAVEMPYQELDSTSPLYH